MVKNQNEEVKNIPQPPVIPPNAIRCIGRPDIQTLYIDKFVFSKRSDGMVITSGIQCIPNLEIEQLRFLINENHAKNLLDNLAKLIDYYPVKNNTQDKTPQLEPKAEKAKKAVSAKQKKFVSKKKQASK